MGLSKAHLTIDGVRLIPHAWGKVHPTMDGVGLMRVHSSGDIDTGGYRVRGNHFFSGV